MASKRLVVSDLDFDAIKTNLKEFLKGQDQFSDYDFEGSSLAVLVDLLAFNTHYNALYNNLAVNEVFLDSASKRNSVVSTAKNLGYIPRSARCASATITITVNNPTTTDTILTLPKYSQFTTNINNIDYIFYTLDAVTVSKNSNGTFVFPSVKIYEGTPLTYTAVYSAGMKLTLPNRGTDTTTIKVKVQDSLEVGVFETYSLATNIIDVAATSKVYFVKEIENELQQLEFGNGVIGNQIEDGQKIVVEYMVSNLDAANGAKSFSFNSSLGGGTVSIVVSEAAHGGADVEDIESVRFNAPKYYASQNRGVSADDIKAIIKDKYPDIESISVWGGEDNVPPIYGKAYVCIKPMSAEVLTQAEKDSIKQDILSSRKVLTITPELVDPDYVNVEVSVSVYYDDSKTTKSKEDIKSLVVQQIKDYSLNNLERFDGIFRFSNFTTGIDKSDTSITNNTTVIKLHRPIDVFYNIPATYVVNVGNPIFQSGTPNNTILSTGFYLSGSTNIYYLDDNGAGSIRLFYIDNNTKIIANASIGTVDYTTGLITINELKIVALADGEFKLVIIPESNDVVASKSNIVMIPSDLIAVQVVVDPISNGNKNYVWAPNR